MVALDQTGEGEGLGRGQDRPIIAVNAVLITAHSRTAIGGGPDDGNRRGVRVEPGGRRCDRNGRGDGIDPERHRPGGQVPGIVVRLDVDRVQTVRETAEAVGDRSRLG